MPFVYVGSQDVFMLSLCYRVGKLFSDCGLSHSPPLDSNIVSDERYSKLFLSASRQSIFKLNICRFTKAAPKRFPSVLSGFWI